MCLEKNGTQPSKASASETPRLLLRVPDLREKLQTAEAAVPRRQVNWAREERATGRGPGAVSGWGLARGAQAAQGPENPRMAPAPVR